MYVYHIYAKAACMYVDITNKAITMIFLRFVSDLQTYVTDLQQVNVLASLYTRVL